MVWYTSIYIARLSQMSLMRYSTLVPGKQPSFQALFEGAKVLCAECAPKTPQNGRNWQFQAKTPKYRNRNISETIRPIKTKLIDDQA